MSLKHLHQWGCEHVFTFISANHSGCWRNQSVKSHTVMYLRLRYMFSASSSVHHFESIQSVLSNIMWRNLSGCQQQCSTTETKYNKSPSACSRLFPPLYGTDTRRALKCTENDHLLSLRAGTMGSEYMSEQRRAKESRVLINAEETMHVWSLLLEQVLYSLRFDFTAPGRTMERQDYLLSRCVRLRRSLRLHSTSIC